MQNLRIESAAEALETLRMATDAADIGVWDLDIRSGNLNWSARCREIFGVPKDAPLKYEDFLERLDKSDLQTVDAAVQAALDPSGAGEYDIEYRVCRPSGEVRWAAAKGKAFFEKIGDRKVPVRFIGTILDRTEQKQSQEALFHAERMAGTGRLAASIAHEINNPLEAAINLLYLLRTEKDESQRNAFLSLAEAELARVTEVATNTLRFYRDPIGDSSVDLAALIRSVLVVFRGKITLKNVIVRLDLIDLHHTTAQGELRQVLVNLVSNALDAMPGGGCLRIRTRYHAKLNETAGGISILVSDSGHGMSPEVKAKLFTSFHTTKGAAGTGLGLWLSAQIIRKLGLRLHVKSATGKGTTFRIFLPDSA